MISEKWPILDILFIEIFKNIFWCKKLICFIIGTIAALSVQGSLQKILKGQWLPSWHFLFLAFSPSVSDTNRHICFGFNMNDFPVTPTAYTPWGSTELRWQPLFLCGLLSPENFHLVTTEKGRSKMPKACRYMALKHVFSDLIGGQIQVWLCPKCVAAQIGLLPLHTLKDYVFTSRSPDLLLTTDSAWIIFFSVIEIE